MRLDLLSLDAIHFFATKETGRYVFPYPQVIELAEITPISIYARETLTSE